MLRKSYKCGYIPHVNYAIGNILSIRFKYERYCGGILWRVIKLKLLYILWIFSGGLNIVTAQIFVCISVH